MKLLNEFFFFFADLANCWNEKKKRLLFDYRIKFLCGLIWGSTLQCLIWNQKVKMRLCFSLPEKVPEFVKKHNQDLVSFYHFERDTRTKWSWSNELKTNLRVRAKKKKLPNEKGTVRGNVFAYDWAFLRTMSNIKTADVLKEMWETYDTNKNRFLTK